MRLTRSKFLPVQ